MYYRVPNLGKNITLTFLIISNCFGLSYNRILSSLFVYFLSYRPNNQI